MNKYKYKKELELQKEMNESKNKLVDNLFTLSNSNLITKKTIKSYIEHNELMIEIYKKELNEYKDFLYNIEQDINKYYFEKIDDGGEG